MLTVDIKISGMGLTIAHETYLIADFLRSKGFDVEVKDEYPPEEGFDFNTREPRSKIIITANHLPWPG